MGLTKKQAKEEARDIIQHALGVAYYELENKDYTEAEIELITQYINKEATRLLKLINREYIAY